MAIGTPSFSTQQFRTAESATLVNMPASVPSGDFLFIWGRVNNNPLVTLPAGWTSVVSFSRTGNTLAPAIFFAYKTGGAAGTEGGTTVSVTHSNNISTWISGTVSGVDLTTPIDATPLTGDTGSASTSSSLSGYTTTVAGCLGFFMASVTGTAATSTPPAGWTERADNTAGSNAGTLATLAALASGSQGTVANTWSANLAHIEAMFALRPASTSTNVNVSGAASALAIDAPAGTVSTQTNIAVSGAATALVLAAPAGTVSTQTNVSLTGTVVNVALAAPAGTVTTSGAVNVSAPAASLVLAAPAGTVATQKNVALTGVVANLALAAPAGSVSLGTNVTLAGTVVTLTLAAPAGSVSVPISVSLSAPPATLTLVASAGTVVVVSDTTIHFVSPVTRRISNDRDVWWRHTFTERSISILKFGSQYREVEGPSAEDVEAADKAYLGGRVYTVDALEAASLTAAGYGAGIT